MKNNYDIIIAGGGLAGLCLAKQLHLQCPSLTIAIIEKSPHPAPEAAFKVGESSIEISSHYFAKQLQLDDHLRESQLPKAGLRFFLTHGDNQTIEKRLEFGESFFSDTPSFQIARGRFENFLHQQLKTLNTVTFFDSTCVSQVALGDEQHRVTLDNISLPTLTCRWFIDATGRFNLLKRQLTLAKPCAHNCSAAWFRIKGELSPDDWSIDSSWRARTPEGFRRLSTNHLLGRGYWVWLIPLATGDTSIGIVADSEHHPFNTFNRQEKALTWLAHYEPQLHKALQSAEFLDFLSLRHYSHHCQQVFSAQRWAITGDAGVFLDPLYSPGSDFIAMSNHFITALIDADYQQQSIAKPVLFYNHLYFKIFAHFLPNYQQQYDLLGCANQMTDKLIWDYANYWATIAFLFFQQRVTDLDFMFNSTVVNALQTVATLNHKVQAYLREQSQQSSTASGFIDYLRIPFLKQLNDKLTTPQLSQQATIAQLQDNINTLRHLSDNILFGQSDNSVLDAAMKNVRACISMVE